MADSRPARLHVVATLSDPIEDAPNPVPEPGDVRIFAFVDPGVDRDGNARPPATVPLETMGVEIEPVLYQRGAQTRYETLIPASPEGFASRPVTFQPPPVDGLEPPYGPVRWFVFERAGPREVTVGPAEDLRLPLRMPEEPDTPEPGLRHRGVAVRSGDRTLVSFSGPGRPPEDLYIPGGYLHRPGIAEVRVGVAGTQHRTDPLRNGEHVVESDYVVTPVVGVGLDWSVEVP